jgi:hypothetical protein
MTAYTCFILTHRKTVIDGRLNVDFMGRVLTSIHLIELRGWRGIDTEAVFTCDINTFTMTI